ncbi:hypothetical protein J32TS6_13980 [Virgibacillus pantothenticus]|uniref:hypothetical protein n=1 Tax=Virgibacillus TaxID=84406 RepID=UPI00067B91D0|nr:MULTISPECIES: hypothetical protein [Virgibacillus]API93055.1 hypothetical protein BKP57_15310 [Virgibacillus sp. 6R]MBS7429263.1 hypothetical protein [Virgibacillus sp. 19R1-5]MBU8568712.1 hypothetical protein [Virgibacillus pantothenticus]MBU8602757.1 hypothetical protein [Virgibacillus pantothenticus]MBU8636878.1 hypothetical protein [Virgibacillus pantothenticus]
MNWIRNQFIHSTEKAPKTVFFGHTPTGLIHDEKDNYDIWTSEKGDKVDIDGGCAFGGQLDAIKTDKKGNILQKIAIASEMNQ